MSITAYNFHMALSLRVKMIKHLCIFYLSNGYFYYFISVLFLKTVTTLLTFFNIYFHLRLMNVFTYNLRWGFLEAEAEIGILMQVAYGRNVSEETYKDTG